MTLIRMPYVFLSLAHEQVFFKDLKHLTYFSTTHF